VTYKAAEDSRVSFLYVLALISANLAVVNSLPVPIVDGGTFVLLIIEGLKGSPLSLRVQTALTYAGLLLIVGLFVGLTWMDVVHLLG
jgi:regulator of sigma E protease